MARDRCPARANRRVSAIGELLAGGPDRPVRAVLGALPRPRRRVGRARRPAGRRQRALPRVLEPGLHAARPEPRQRADSAPGQEHRHRTRAQPDGGDASRQGDGVRDRPVRAADRARRGALGPPLRRGLSDRPGAPGARRPRTGDDVPDRRRRRPLQRRSRLRAAPCDAARDPLRALAGSRDRLSGPLCTGREGADGGRVPRAGASSASWSANGLRPRRRASAERSSRG